MSREGCHPQCDRFAGHIGNCSRRGFGELVLFHPGHPGHMLPWNGSHPPPTPPIAEPCGCDEAKALRAEVSALRARLALPARRLLELAEMLARDLSEHPMGQHGRVAYVSREELAELVRGYAGRVAPGDQR